MKVGEMLKSHIDEGKDPDMTICDAIIDALTICEMGGLTNPSSGCTCLLDDLGSCGQIYWDCTAIPSDDDSGASEEDE